jgi:hypothetical protein
MRDLEKALTDGTIPQAISNQRSGAVHTSLRLCHVACRKGGNSRGGDFLSGVDETDRLLENGCKTDGRRYSEDLTRTEIVDFF